MKSKPLFIFMLLFLAKPCMAAQSHTFSDAEEKSIQAFLDEHWASTKSAMVVGLVDERGTKVLSAGQLDNGPEKKPDGDSMFFIGSLSKTFTALLLLDMAERGEVKLDDPAAKYLPATMKVPAFKERQITLFDLATHTSALPCSPDNMVNGDTRVDYETYTVEMLDDFVSRYKLTYAPGKEFQYTNVGMALLGQALEQRTGKSYEALVVERICQPLGMTSTAVDMTPELESRLAMGHDEEGQPSRPFKLQAYKPAGGILSTANDLLKYAAAQAGLRPTSLAGSIAKSHVIHSVDLRGLPPDNRPRMGRTAVDWVDRDCVQPAGMDLLGHAGGAGSYHAWLGFDQKQHRGVVVLTTVNGIVVDAVGWTILQQLPLTSESTNSFAREMLGIGATLAMDKTTGALTITKVLENSPALEAKLTTGLVIQKIDDHPTEGKTLEECMKLMRGAAGTKVQLDVLDSASNEAHSVEVTRKRFATLSS